MSAWSNSTEVRISAIGKVMHELRTFVEERGVVLVAFENELAALGHGEAGAEVLGNSADEKRWLASRHVEDPGQHRCRRRLAMGAGDGQHLPAAQKLLMHQGGHGSERQPLIQHVFHFDIAARKGVADHDQIGARAQVRFRKRLRDHNANARQEIRHRRIGRDIGAGDEKAALLQHAGERRHGGAADSNQMDMARLHRPCALPGRVRSRPRRCATARTNSLTFNSTSTPKGKRHVVARHVAGRNSVGDGNAEAPDNARHDLLQRILLAAGLHAIEHLAEDDATHAVELAGKFQLHQHAVDLVRLCRHVFQKQDAAFGLQLVSRAERRSHNREASAAEHSAGRALHERLDR